MNTLQKGIKNIHMERVIWCIAIAAFCWTDVPDYFHMMNNKDLCIFTFIGLYYVYKMGAFEKGNRIISLFCGAAGVFLMIYFIKTEFFLYEAGYRYYSYTIGALCIPVFIQYGLLIKKIFDLKKLPKLSWVTLIYIMMLLVMTVSPLKEKEQYYHLLIILFPYCCMELSRERQKDIFVGIIDGLCLGFIICQTYTFLFRPYIIYDSYYRTKAFRSYCTYASVSYLQFYIGCLLRYAVWLKDKRRPFLRKIFFLLAIFVISLLYLTGGRGPFVGVMVITALVLGFVSYHKKAIRFLFPWLSKGLVIGLASILLFPIAYAGTRYLPTVLNMYDLYDGFEGRTYSFATLVLGVEQKEEFEYEMACIKKGEVIDECMYVTFEEALTGTLGRIIPGARDILEDLFEEKIEAAVNKRYYYMDNYNNPQARIKGLSFLDWAKDSIYLVGVSNDIGVSEYARVYSLSQIAEGRGESSDSGWYNNATELPEGLGVREGIYLYAIAKLNWTGHEKSTFDMYPYVGSDFKYTHAHNIFLQFGYDYGIGAMIVMVVWFVFFCGCSIRKYVQTKDVSCLLPAALIIGFSIYGFFDVGFNCRDSYPLIIIMTTLLWRADKRIDA